MKTISLPPPPPSKAHKKQSLGSYDNLNNNHNNAFSSAQGAVQNPLLLCNLSKQEMFKIKSTYYQIVQKSNEKRFPSQFETWEENYFLENLERMEKTESYKKLSKDLRFKYLRYYYKEPQYQFLTNKL